MGTERAELEEAEGLDTSAAVMVALQWPKFSHHLSVLLMCCCSSLCSFSMAPISSFSLLTICNHLGGRRC